MGLCDYKLCFFSCRPKPGIWIPGDLSVRNRSTSLYSAALPPSAIARAFYRFSTLIGRRAQFTSVDRLALHTIALT
jgi:hypothetical protein